MDLKPCLFCKSEANAYAKKVFSWLGVATCKSKDCGAEIAILGPSQEAALAGVIAKWNTRPSPWQPIETAPKDQIIDMFDDFDDERNINCEWVEMFEGQFMWINERGFPVTATHWMPRPEPPK